MKLIKLLILSIFLTGVVPLSDLGSLQAESSEQQKKKEKRRKRQVKSHLPKRKRRKNLVNNHLPKEKERKKRKRKPVMVMPQARQILRLRLLNLHLAQKNQTDQIQLPMQTSYLLLQVS